VGGVAGVALPGVRRAHRIRGNVPLLSYVLLRVRCRNCKARISARYPLVEALTGILFAGAVYEFGLGLELLFALALVLALVALAGTDLEYQLLPNVIVGPAALVGSRSRCCKARRDGGCTLSLPSPSRAGSSLWSSPTLEAWVWGTSRWTGCSELSWDPTRRWRCFSRALCGAITGGLLIAVGKM
jgi:hypothetical protein